MEILYRSTRGGGAAVKASEAILKGLADDGGLFVPEYIPAMDKSLAELSQMTYQEVAYEVMKLFFTDFTEEELKNCINKAYYNGKCKDSRHNQIFFHVVFSCSYPILNTLLTYAANPPIKQTHSTASRKYRAISKNKYFLSFFLSFKKI